MDIFWNYTIFRVRNKDSFLRNNPLPLQKTNKQTNKQNKKHPKKKNPGYTLFFYKNVVFPPQAEYYYFSADFKLRIFLYYSYYS